MGNAPRHKDERHLEEKEAVLMQQHPILIGKQGRDYLNFEGSEHAALYARTGTGKTSSVVIPNCFSWRGSLVVLDVKGEAFRATAGYRSAVLGQDVYRFDPAAESERTHRWNPLQPVQRSSRPSQTWGVCRPLVRVADWVEHSESGMIRVAMTYRVCSPPRFETVS
jgi:type IV secretory pathway TraG/TraD family ATPase VirD4